jgi:pyruvate dehydrogenase E1 component
VSRLELLDRIQKKVLWLGTYMVHHANSLRPNADGVKVGGHQASSS